MSEWLRSRDFEGVSCQREGGEIEGSELEYYMLGHSEGGGEKDGRRREREEEQRLDYGLL